MYLALRPHMPVEEAKVQVINIWASWCPPCKREVPELMRLREAFSAKELFVFGLSIDENEEAYKKFVQEKNINYSVMRLTPEMENILQASLSIPVTWVVTENKELAKVYKGLVDYKTLHNDISNLLNR